MLLSLYLGNSRRRCHLAPTQEGPVNKSLLARIPTPVLVIFGMGVVFVLALVLS